jgi:hypothetical protein
MTEAHMFKPFDRRVEATLTFLQVMDRLMEEKREVIFNLKATADRSVETMDKVITKWQLSSQVDSILFKGYEVTRVPGLIKPGTELLQYDRSRTYEKNIPYYGTHREAGSFEIPAFYLVPQAWHEVLERLDANHVQMEKLKSDTLIEVTALYASYFETNEYPYEGHYIHKNTGATERRVKLTFRKGDYLIPARQKAAKYLAYVFDPKSPDSFFNWNFFDAILNQKEYYSSYVFEITAAELLERDVTLRRTFEKMKSTDKDFAESREAQLKFIYDNSVWHEDSHLRIPVYFVYP